MFIFFIYSIMFLFYQSLQAGFELQTKEDWKKYNLIKEHPALTENYFCLGGVLNCQEYSVTPDGRHLVADTIEFDRRIVSIFSLGGKLLKKDEFTISARYTGPMHFVCSPRGTYIAFKSQQNKILIYDTMLRKISTVKNEYLNAPFELRLFSQDELLFAVEREMRAWGNCCYTSIELWKNEDTPFLENQHWISLPLNNCVYGMNGNIIIKKGYNITLKNINNRDTKGEYTFYKNIDFEKDFVVFSQDNNLCAMAEASGHYIHILKFNANNLFIKSYGKTMLSKINDNYHYDIKQISFSPNGEFVAIHVQESYPPQLWGWYQADPQDIIQIWTIQDDGHCVFVGMFYGQKTNVITSIAMDNSHIYVGITDRLNNNNFLLQCNFLTQKYGTIKKFASPIKKISFNEDGYTHMFVYTEKKELFVYSSAFCLSTELLKTLKGIDLEIQEYKPEELNHITLQYSDSLDAFVQDLKSYYPDQTILEKMLFS